MKARIEKKLGRGDRLPRGTFFNGKTPGRKIVVMDEFWMAKAPSQALS